MSTHKHFERLCLAILILTLFLTVLFMNGGRLGVQAVSDASGYESRLFDASSVHTIDIVMDDWDSFLDTCTDEEYSPCALIIDGESYRNVAIRAKGNTSLTQVAAYGNDRYSFKVEFDHYDSQKTYYGLDKLCLNNIIQDNTYMKEFFSYRMMAEAGAVAPLCSYVNISVNGEPWGLYLAVEGIEESFLTRNYGSDYGELYKPDSMDMGSGNLKTSGSRPSVQPGMFPGQQRNAPSEGMADGQSLMGNSDVLLQYTDDSPASYPNIFDNAKTEVSDKDKTRLIESLQKLANLEDLEQTVDTDSVIRYFVAHNFVLNFDSYTGSMIHNYYLYEKDGQLSMLPWDYNLAFGGFQSAGDADSLVNYPIDTPVFGGAVNDRPMLAWIFSDETYKELYHQYFSEFISEYFDSGRFAAEVDSITALISPYVKEDPTKFCTFEEFEKGADTLKAFCLLRAQSVRNQLNGTIGLTADTQEADTFIQTENLSISDMGSMEGSGEQRGSGRPAEDNTRTNSANTPPELPDSLELPADLQMQAGPRASSVPETPEDSPVIPVLLTGVSALVLLGGLLFAGLFKPRI